MTEFVTPSLKNTGEEVICSYLALKRQLRTLWYLEGDIVGEELCTDPDENQSTKPPEARAYLIRGYQGKDKEPLDYVPLRNVTPDHIQTTSTRDHLISELRSHPKWSAISKGHSHLLTRHREIVERLQNGCPKGTKKEAVVVLDLVLKDIKTMNWGQWITNELEIDWYEFVSPINDNFMFKSAIPEMIDANPQYVGRIRDGRALKQIDAETKHAVIKRDGGKCLICDSTEDLNLHHIIPVNPFYNGRSVVENVATLCEDCHWDAHGNEWRDISYDSKEEFWSWVESANE